MIFGLSNQLVLVGAVGLVLTASIAGNLAQAKALGEQKATSKVLAQRVVDRDEALRKAGEQLKGYQDGNVINREEADRLCRTGTLAAYDAGRLRDSATVAERQAAGAFVPGQRKAGSPR